ncbi:MAG: hypothetical protein U5R06_03925 [candidate division KSB1 bacterium]|nr:hypothetical protein [candidate division KSB1 bacterium]
MKNSSKPGVIIIEGHVQGLANTRALGRAGIPVIVVDTSDCIARHSKYCRSFFKCPGFLDPHFIDFLVELKERETLQDWLLLPSNDHAVYNIAKHRKVLESHFKMITPDLYTIEKIYDKLQLVNLATTLGLPTPKTVAGKVENSTTLHYPVITKGRHGFSFYKTVGTKAILSHDSTELSVNLNRLKERWPLEQSFTQEVIPFDGTNRTISFAAFSVAGEIKTFWMGVKLREHPLRFGTATFCQSLYQQECLDQSVPLLHAMNYTGVCEIEYLRDPRDGHFKLIEINARTWLWVGLAVHCGINFPLYIYNYVNNSPNEFPATYPTTIKWRNYWTDLIYSINDILANHMSYKSYRKSLKGEIIDAVRSKDDPKPFRAMTRMLPKLALSR